MLVFSRVSVDLCTAKSSLKTAIYLFHSLSRSHLRNSVFSAPALKKKFFQPQRKRFLQNEHKLFLHETQLKYEDGILHFHSNLLAHFTDIFRFARNNIFFGGIHFSLLFAGKPLSPCFKVIPFFIALASREVIFADSVPCTEKKSYDE